MSSSERLLAAATVFYAAVTLCLPVPQSEEVAALYPWWGKRIAIGNILLHELVFLGWIVFYGLRRLPKTLLVAGDPARQAALSLVVLALWCGTISLLSPLPWLDLGRTLRLLLNATLILAVVRWTSLAAELTLAALVAGFAAGTVINFVLSFQYPLIVFGTMRLSGQNTPGVAMGIAIHLSAWLFLRTRSLRWRLGALLSAILFAGGCAISYSRIGWFAGGTGLLAWIYVLLVVRPMATFERIRLSRIRMVIVPLLVVGVSTLALSPLGQEGVQWVRLLVEQKLTNQGQSDSIRWAYALGTAEIVSRYPLGVGYSGFFDAMRETDVYHSGLAAEEISMVEANPHATLLWYTTAGGVPGGVAALVVLAMLLGCMFRGMKHSMGRVGIVLSVLIALPYLVVSVTVPYLFNSIVLVIPAGLTAAWGVRAQIARTVSRVDGQWSGVTSTT